MRLTKTSATKGFSLIELLVVIAIIGILTALALPGYQSYRIKTTIAEAQRMGLALTAEASAIYEETGEFPGMGSAHVEVPVTEHDYIRAYSFWTNGGDATGRQDGKTYAKGQIGTVQIYFHADLYPGSSNQVRLTYDYMADEFGNGGWLCVQHYIATLQMDEEYQPTGCQNPSRF